MTDSIGSYFSPEHDFPYRYGEPASEYIIASTPRSGSTLLASVLWASGTCGAPLEYLNENFFGPVIRRRHYTSICDYYYNMRRLRTSPNGVFGVKLFTHHLRNIAGRAPDLLKVVRPQKVIFLERGDKLAQAISLHRAKQSGAWASFETAETASYSYEAILQCLGDIDRQEDEWKQIFEYWEIAPLRLRYENAVASWPTTLEQIENLLECGLRAPEEGIIPLGVQRDSLSQNWRERFQRDVQEYGPALRQDLLVVANP